MAIPSSDILKHLLYTHTHTHTVQMKSHHWKVILLDIEGNTLAKDIQTHGELAESKLPRWNTGEQPKLKTRGMQGEP